MTTRDPNDLRDPRFDAAWRAASREEPPPSLDDAIRAAARREAGAGPLRANRVPEALRPERWWWPLAAAATIGAVAIGLLQLANPDQVGAPAGDKSIVTDMPAAPVTPGKQLDQVEREEAPAPPREDAAKPAATPPAAAPGFANDAQRNRIAPAPVTAPPVPSAATALRKDAVPRTAQEERAETRATTPVQAPASATVAEPFPADALKREAKEGLAAAGAPPVRNADSTGQAFTTGKLAATPPPASSIDSARGAQRASASAAMPAAPEPPMPARRAQEGEVPLVSAGASAGADAVPETKPDARAKVQQKLPVADWITLIRKLRDEGRVEDAAKELAAFRAAHADHSRLLPPDLRDWPPAAK